MLISFGLRCARNLKVLNPMIRPRGHPDDLVGGQRVAISKELEVLARGVGQAMGRGRVGTSWGPAEGPVSLTGSAGQRVSGS